MDRLPRKLLPQDRHDGPVGGNGVRSKRDISIEPTGLRSWLTLGGIQGGRRVSHESDFWLASQLDADTEMGNSAGEKVDREG